MIQAVCDPNGRRWRVEGPGWTMQPEGALSAGAAEAMCRATAKALKTLAYRRAIAVATEEARQAIKPGDRVTRNRCGGGHGTFTFVAWDGDRLCGRTVADCHAADIVSVNGKPVRFGDPSVIEAAHAALSEIPF